jgi:hypothetical protein
MLTEKGLSTALHSGILRGLPSYPHPLIVLILVHLAGHDHHPDEEHRANYPECKSSIPAGAFAKPY